MINQYTIGIAFLIVIIAIGLALGLTRPDIASGPDSALEAHEGPPGFPVPSRGEGQTPSSGVSQPSGFQESGVDFLPTPNGGSDPDSGTIQKPSTAVDSGGQIEVANRETLTIDTSTGPVTINNVLIDPQEVLQGGWGVVMERTTQYTLIYYEPDEAFRIVINDPDVQRARDDAEWEFLQEVGIAPGDACKLEVSLVVTGDVNLDLAGVNYGLSFCPGGKAFPL